MQNIYSIARLSSIILVLFFITKVVSAQFVYLNPLPGSKNHNPQTTIAIKNGSIINETSLKSRDWIEIIGSKSGSHTWTARLSDDKKTIIVKPQPVFDFDETVSITIQSKLKKQNGHTINGTSFSFQTRQALTPEQEELKQQAIRTTHAGEFEDDSQPSSDTRDNDLDSLPSFTLIVNNNAAPGQIFYNNQYDLDPNNTNCFNTIIENDGSIVYSKDMGVNGHDFKINYDGHVTYTDYTHNQWIVVDSNYAHIDSMSPGNGYDVLNPHDLSLYSDHHALILIDDYEPMDMTAYGGLPNALVNMGVIQELDANHDVVFEWRGVDHFQVTDADTFVVLTSVAIDLIHFNAVSFDNDGNVLLSSRFLSEVTKINHDTGDIIWRLGGFNNQFTFVNDNIPEHFSYQHDARRIANGNLTLYNNGNHLVPPRSTAKEYQLDEVNHVATLIWYYEHPPVGGYGVNGPATGSVQRLQNGNTLISWGTNNTHPDRPAFTEVDSSGNITWELHFDQTGQKAYRVHKYVWDPCAPIDFTYVKVKKITATSAKVYWKKVHNATSYEIQFRKLGNATWKSKSTPYAVVQLTRLLANNSYEYQLRTHCANGYASDWTPLDTFKTHPAKLLSDENQDASSVEIFPNPVSDVLTMKIASDQDQQILIRIYDIGGRLMLTHTQTISEGEQELKMNISGLPAGYYLASVNAPFLNQTLKFVKE